MTPTALRLVELGPDDALFDAWCGVWAAAEKADRPGDAPRTTDDHAALGRQLVAPGGSRDGTHRAAVLGEEVVGALRLLCPLRDNTSVAFIDVAVHPTHRRRGIGGVLLTEALRLAAAAGRSELISEVDEPGPDMSGRLFALRYGWMCDLLETRRDLVLPADEARLAAVEADARQVSRDYELVTWRDRVPERLVDDRAVLEERMSTDAPHGDLPVDEERWDADRIREHRGHRLGALVKAAVLRDLATAFPQTRLITTYNLEGNAPMVAVNAALGFEPAGQISMWSLRPASGRRSG